MVSVRRFAAFTSGVAWLMTAYDLVIPPWHLRWGRDEGRGGRLPGDGIVGTPTVVGTRTITIGAAQNQVWPWLVQQGFGRAGWYSWRVDNACGAARTALCPGCSESPSVIFCSQVRGSASK